MIKRVDVEDLRAFVEALFEAAGLERADAVVCADAFIVQELRGVQTHGLRRLRGMVDGVKDGELNAAPQRRIVSEQGGTVVLDGDLGCGILSCVDGMQQAVRLAREYGIGMCVVVNSNHFLAAAPYCLQAAEEGVISLVMAGGGGGMAYPGTSAGALGNSPTGFGIPTGAGFPLIFDAAMTLSGGKMVQWAKTGVDQIPEGFLGYDSDGNETTDPAKIVYGGAPLPIGGHKGGGLAIFMDVLTAVISGGGFLRTLVPDDHPEWKRSGTTHNLIAIDIERFMPLEDFRERMSAYVADMKAKPLAPGYDEILLPGERAARHMAECRANGIALDEDVQERITTLSERYSVPLPTLT